MQKHVRDAYITAAGKFLPGDPIDNDRMEAYLGLVAGHPSRYRSKVLEANGIKSRHYARLADGTQTHLNEELAANAVLDALKNRSLDLSEIGMLAFGTTAADLLMPGFGVMVHGRLGGPPMEVLSAAGVCASSVAAMRAAVNAVRVGDHDRAICGGSELPSTMLQGHRFEAESQVERDSAEGSPSFQYFNADFLRWMLSDGAGAAVVEAKPRQRGVSLRVEWISLTSYANEHDTCMYWGCSNPTTPRPGNTWLSAPSFAAAERDGLMLIRQDTKLLGREMMQMGVADLRRLLKEKCVDTRRITHFLPHLSSYFFEDRLHQALGEAGIDLPKERWYTNLRTRGNTGSASLYILLADAFEEGLFKPGDSILTMVPESGRFSISFGLFTCVHAA